MTVITVHVSTQMCHMVLHHFLTEWITVSSLQIFIIEFRKSTNSTTLAAYSNLVISVFAIGALLLA